MFGYAPPGCTTQDPAPCRAAGSRENGSVGLLYGMVISVRVGFGEVRSTLTNLLAKKVDAYISPSGPVLRSHGAARGVIKSKKVNLFACAVGAAMVLENKAAPISREGKEENIMQ